jgi:hypothetical protein
MGKPRVIYIVEVNKDHSTGNKAEWLYDSKHSTLKAAEERQQKHRVLHPNWWIRVRGTTGND